jgi:hypothetical protein
MLHADGCWMVCFGGSVSVVMVVWLWVRLRGVCFVCVFWSVGLWCEVSSECLAVLQLVGEFTRHMLMNI